METRISQCGLGIQIMVFLSKKTYVTYFHFIIFVKLIMSDKHTLAIKFNLLSILILVSISFFNIFFLNFFKI